MFNLYGKLSSEVYEIDKYIGKSYGDVEYYYEQLKGVKGKILEPATGNGRILISLVEKGLDIEGFDFSDSMLDLFDKNCKQRSLHAKVSKLEMSNFTISKKYEAIIVPTGSFLLLHQLEKSIKALTCFHQHLEVNGRLILDLLLPIHFKEGLIKKRAFTTKENAVITLEESLVEMDHINQFCMYHNHYEKWSDGRLIGSELEIFPLRWYGVKEFSLILEKIGFEVRTISADYQHNQYPTKNSQTITFEAVKI